VIDFFALLIDVRYVPKFANNYPNINDTYGAIAASNLVIGSMTETGRRLLPTLKPPVSLVGA
jgi:hypothetical protein